MKNIFKRIILSTVLGAFAFTASAQEAMSTGFSSQTAAAYGDQTFAGGSGSLLIDGMIVSAPGSKIGGLLTASDAGSASGAGLSTFQGGIVGQLTIKAIPGKITGSGGSEQFASAQTTPGGTAQSSIAGQTTLVGQVKLPVDPTIEGMAQDSASSMNTLGLPATSSGMNWVDVGLSAKMWH